MIKKFEQMNWNEDWEEENPNVGPFDDQLKYGKDGTDFKCGDRVKCSLFDNKIGTVINNLYNNYLVCFDKNIGSSSGSNPKYNLPKGHGCWVEKDYLKKLN